MPSINSPTPDATTTTKGKVTLAGALSGTAASPSIKAPSSQTNTGTAGGTIYYVDLGGFKMAWGTTGSLTASGASPAATAYTIVWPTSFFNTIQSAQIGAASGTAANSANIYTAPNAAVTASNWNFFVASSAGANGTTTFASFFVIGN